MWQGVVLLGRCSPPQNGCSLINPVLNMAVNSRRQLGFCGLWHRCHGQQVQAILAAAGSLLTCPSIHLALPLGKDGNHSSPHSLSEQPCLSFLGDSWTRSLVGRPKELVTLVDFHTSPHFFCQARRVLAHITSWDQHAHCSGTREGLVASHTADAVLLSPCILFPKPRSQQLS